MTSISPARTVRSSAASAGPRRNRRSSLGDVGDLFVGVLMAWNGAALFQFQAREHGLGAGDELAGELVVELLDGNLLPGGVLRSGGDSHGA